MQDDLIRRKDVLWITKETGALETQGRVLALPSVDAVEVVRCRECKNARPLTVEGFVACILWCRFFHCDGFCYMGEKMDAKDTNVPTKTDKED